MKCGTEMIRTDCVCQCWGEEMIWSGKQNLEGLSLPLSLILYSHIPSHDSESPALLTTLRARHSFTQSFVSMTHSSFNVQNFCVK